MGFVWMCQLNSTYGIQKKESREQQQTSKQTSFSLMFFPECKKKKKNVPPLFVNSAEASTDGTHMAKVRANTAIILLMSSGL